MKKIQIYTTSYCPYCMGAKEILKSKNLAFEEIDVENNQELRDELSEKYNYQTVPMIFIDGKFIGGFSDLQQLEAEGKL